MAAWRQSMELRSSVRDAYSAAAENPGQVFPSWWGAASPKAWDVPAGRGVSTIPNIDTNNRRARDVTPDQCPSDASQAGESDSPAPGGDRRAPAGARLSCA